MKANSDLTPPDIFLLSKTSFLVFVIMVIYELLKTVLIPEINLLVSHLLTIFFTTFLFIVILNKYLRQSRAEKDQIQESNSEYEKRYLSLIESIPLGIFRTTIDPEGHFISANPISIKIFDLVGQDINSVKVRDLYNNPKRRDEIREKLARYGSVENEEIEFKTPRGKVFWGRISAIIKNDENDQKYIEGFISNIDECKKAQEKLERATQELEKLNLLIVDRELKMSDLKKEISDIRNHV